MPELPLVAAHRHGSENSNGADGLKWFLIDNSLEMVFKPAFLPHLILNIETESTPSPTDGSRKQISCSCHQTVKAWKKLKSTKFLKSSLRFTQTQHVHPLVLLQFNSILNNFYKLTYILINYFIDIDSHCLLKGEFKADLPGLSSPCKDFCCFCLKGSSGWEGLKAGLPPLPLIQKSKNSLLQRIFFL